MSKCPICARNVRPGSRQALCLRCRSGFANLRVVDDVDDDRPTIVARGGYPPSLQEVLHGDDD